MNSCVIVLSGGLDSTVLAYLMRLNLMPMTAVSFDYGQRHKKELEYAVHTAGVMGIEHRIVNLRELAKQLSNSALTNPSIPVPHGHYADESMKITIVSNRNAIFLSIAAGIAHSLGYNGVAIGVHAGDHAIYPDCRPAFIQAMNEMLDVALPQPAVRIHAPFVHQTKSQIVQAGQTLGVPFEYTWSCYEGGKYHCGKCGTDVERKEAFRLAKVPDPTIYEDDTGAFRG